MLTCINLEHRKRILAFAFCSTSCPHQWLNIIDEHPNSDDHHVKTISDMEFHLQWPCFWSQTKFQVDRRSPPISRWKYPPVCRAGIPLMMLASLQYLVVWSNTNWSSIHSVQSQTRPIPNSSHQISARVVSKWYHHYFRLLLQMVQC